LNVEAEIHVTDPDDVVDDYRRGFYAADVEISLAQDPNLVVIKGDKTEVMKCLVDEFGVPDNETERYITSELLEKDDDTMDNVCDMCGEEMSPEQAVKLGQMNPICRKCAAEYAEDNKLDRQDETDTEMIDCPECLGSGRPGEGHPDENDLCWFCGGSGEVHKDVDTKVGDYEPRYDPNESINFDKFMDSTLIKEHRNKKMDSITVSPLRQRAAKHQERPLGRIRFKGGR
jgi:DNA-directed RNA polymerase subunit RPC12/RpoP